MSKAKSKPGPRSAKANKAATSRAAPSPSPPPTSAKKRKKSNVNGDHEGDDQQSLLDDIGPDEEEAFSSVGPYQCEICQVKAEVKSIPDLKAVGVPFAGVVSKRILIHFCYPMFCHNFIPSHMMICTIIRELSSSD